MNIEEILALYDWAPGDCFRCAAAGVDATFIDAICTRGGERYEARACRNCVLAIEGEQRADAERRGERYVPGRLGSRMS